MIIYKFRKLQLDLIAEGAENLFHETLNKS
jgi:hypothetical protein